MTDIAFPPVDEKSLPFKIAAVELKRYLDRVANPILEKIIENSSFNTTVILHHISQPNENKELLQIWYQLELKESLGQEIWNQITDVFYGYDPNYPEMDQNNLVPKARDYLNTFKLDGFNNWDFTAFEIRQSAKAGVGTYGRLSPIPGALNIETFTLTINSVNDAPVIQTMANATIDEDASYTITIPVTDVEDQASLTYAISGESTFTSEVVNGSLTVTPAANWNGEGIVSLAISDPSGASASQNFNLTVNPVPDAPIFTDQENSRYQNLHKLTCLQSALNATELI